MGPRDREIHQKGRVIEFRYKFRDFFYKSPSNGLGPVLMGRFKIFILN